MSSTPVRKQPLPKRIAVSPTLHLAVNLIDPQTLAAISSDRPNSTEGLYLPVQGDIVDGLVANIYIDKTLSLERRWSRLRHEIQHFLIDAEYLVKDDK